MTNNTKKIITAIVLAGGQGKRMNSNVHKQYMLLGKRPLICYALEAFQNSIVDQIILVVGEGETNYSIENIVNPGGFSKVVKVVEGGKERYHSVYEGIKAAQGSDYVLIHDGARPMVDEEMISRIVAETIKYSACVAAMPVKDTIKISDEDGYASLTPDRSTLWMIQTPQSFEYTLIKEAYDKLFTNISYQQGITDDAMVVEKMTSQKVKLVEGSYLNIKVTTPEDIQVAEVFLKMNKRN